jgi:tight adherence protein C
MTFLLPLFAFLFASLLVTAGAMALSPGAAAAISRRLDEIRGDPAVEAPSPYRQKVADGLASLSKYAPTPTKEMGKLRARLVAAGYRRPEALAVFIGARLGFAVVSFALLALPLFGRPNVPVAIGAGALGYLLPGMVLGRVAQRRQHRIRLSLPDALDLMVVSVEAGLGLDQAIQRVGEELAFAHPELSAARRARTLFITWRPGPASMTCRRSSRCWCRPTSSAPVWHSRCAFTRTHYVPSAASAPRRPRRRPA